MSRIAVPVERHVLDNGLRVVLSPDDALPVVAVNLWYAVGSRNERPGRTGFAHLFEHMMFQGSKHVPKNAHFEMIEGAGGSLNATTSFDRTNYFETVPSHHVELALWLEADRMGWLLPAMTQEKLDNQRDVVKNEKRQRYDNRPYGDWSERVQRRLFPPDHPYHHTVIGSMDDLDAADLDDIRAFFETFYRPNNCVLSLAGDFDVAAAADAVERYFGEIEPGPPPPPVPGRREIEPVVGSTLRDRVVADVPLPRVMVAARIPPAIDDAFYAAGAAARVLGVGHASRLYQRLVRERRVAKDVWSVAFPLITGSSMLLVRATGYAATDPDELGSLLEGELDAMRDVEDREVERSVAMAETGFVRSVERAAHRADLLSRYTTLFDDAGRINGEIDRIAAVTAADVRRFAARFLGPDNRLLLTYVPEASA